MLCTLVNYSGDLNVMMPFCILNYICLTFHFFSAFNCCQAKLAEAYPCHYSNAALMCLMGSIQASILALCVERHRIQWRLGFDIRLLTAAYSVRGFLLHPLVFSGNLIILCHRIFLFLGSFINHVSLHGCSVYIWRSVMLNRAK